MKEKTLKIIKAVSFFILFFIYQDLFLIIFNIDTSKLNSTNLILLNFGLNLLFLIPLLIAYRKDLIKDFKDLKKNFYHIFEQAIKYWMIGFIVMITANLIINFFGLGAAGNETGVRNMIDKAPLYMIFATSIFAPFTEELMFRKGIRDILNKKWPFILTSGIVFGTLHVITNISKPIDFVHLIPYCALGIAFSSLYYKSNNIWSTIIMHCLHNTIAVVLYIIGSGI